MTGLTSVVLALLIQQVAPATPAWTWTLYDDNPLVLANEVPDTARLRSTFECEPGSSVVRPGPRFCPRDRRFGGDHRRGGARPGRRAASGPAQ